MDVSLADATLSHGGRGGLPPGFIAFILLCGVLGIGSVVFFTFNRNAALKRRIWPGFIIGGGLLFVSFVYFSVGQQQPELLYFLLPMTALVSFINIRSTRFCDACGRTLTRQPILKRTQFCPHCGAELK